jgi:sugar phosphate isomerase/epimerase
MIFSIVNDEISADLETAIELGAEWGISQFELRGYGTERAPLYSPYQKQRVRELLEEYHVIVCAISPGLFKIPFSAKKRERFPVQTIDSTLYQKWQDGRSLIRYHLEELLPASIDYAKEIGAATIVIFSFMRGEAPPDHIPDEILETLHFAASATGAAGLRLVIEVEDGFWADSGFNTAQIFKSVDQSSLGVNWDPGNAIVSGERPYPEGYECVRRSVYHVHFKDVIRSPEHGFQYRVEGKLIGQVRLRRWRRMVMVAVYR